MKKNTKTYSPDIEDLLDVFPGHIYWKDINGVYLGCNKEHADALGLSSRHDIVGKTDYDLAWKEHAKKLRELDKKVINDRKEYISEERLTLSNGLEIVVQSKKKPLLNKSGDLIGVIGTSIDITNQKTLENNLNREKERALVASKAKSEFIANMSHDIRTPITGVLGLAQSMINHAEAFNGSPLAKLIKEDGSLLINSVNKLLDLCNDILDLVSFDSGKAITKKETFDCYKLIQDNSELLLPVANEKGIDLRFSIAESVPKYIIGCRTCLGRMLLNLASNALKFTSSGYVKINVSADSFNTNKTTIKIDVEDTGIGIPGKDLDLIFEQFSRVAPAYEGKYKGSGIGLFMVKKYVEHMGGDIRVESKLGSGSLFTANIPFEIPKENFSYSNTEKESLNADIELGLKHVLIVEDDALAARALMLTLNDNFDFNTTHASSGEEAVKQATCNNFDLILMDIGLPDFCGIEATKKIRQSNVTTPIFALTGHGNNPQKKQNAIDSGMQEVLTKPATMEKLTAAFNTHFSTQSTQMNKVVMDWDRCVAMCRANEALCKELVEILKDDLCKTKPKLDGYCKNGDINSMRAELHRLRGSVSYLYLPELERALKEFYEEIIASKMINANSLALYKVLTVAMSNVIDMVTLKLAS